MAKDAYYFPHDANARNDQKMMSLRSVKGMKGYGIFFGIIEIMREANAYRIPLNTQSIAYDLRESQEDVEDVIFNYNLFTITDDGKFFHSESLLRRMQHLDNTRVERIKAGKKGGQANAKAKAQAKLKQNSSIKVNESKVNESKFIPPTLEEVQSHFSENNIPLNALEFHSHYEARGWFAGKTKIKKWKSCIQTWLKNKGRFSTDEPKNPLNLNKKQQQNMEALNDFARRHNADTRLIS